MCSFVEGVCLCMWGEGRVRWRASSRGRGGSSHVPVCRHVHRSRPRGRRHLVHHHVALRVLGDVVADRALRGRQQATRGEESRQCGEQEGGGRAARRLGSEAKLLSA